MQTLSAFFRQRARYRNLRADRRRHSIDRPPPRLHSRGDNFGWGLRMSPQIPPPDSSDSSTSPRTSKPSVRQQNLGITPMRHAEIRNAAEHLRKNPSSPQAMALLVAAVISAVERSIERRARGRQVRLQQRAVALVSTYADRLSVELRKRGARTGARSHQSLASPSPNTRPAPTSPRAKPLAGSASQ